MPKQPAFLQSARPLGAHPDNSVALRAAGIMLLASLAAYFGYRLGLPGGFLLDDLVRLPGLAPRDPGLTELIRETLQGLHGAAGRPVSMFTLALTKALSGPSAEAYKYQNILLHLITGLIQFWALAYIIALISPGGKNNQHNAPCWIPAACIAAIWLLHPLFVSTVLYSVQRIAILAALFTWCAVLCYAVARHMLLSNRCIPASLLLYVLVPLFVMLGIGSKENAALIPAYLFLIHTFAPKPTDLAPRATRTNNIATIVLIALPLLGGLGYFLLHLHEFMQGYDERPFSLPERVLTQGYLIWWYASLILFPLLRRMSLYHDNHWVAGIDNLPAYVSSASLLVLAALAFLVRRRAPLIAFGLLFFLVSHLLESTILPLELVFEHRNYAGASGLLLAVYGCLTGLSQRLPSFKTTGFLTPIVIAALIACSTLLAMRSWTWSNNLQLVMTSYREQPASTRVLTELANHYLRQQEPMRAFAYLVEATKRDPDNAGPYVHIYSLKCTGKLDSKYSRKVLEAVQTKHLTPYAMTGLRALSFLPFKPGCKELNPAEVMQMYASALENPHSSQQDRYNIYLAAARVMYSSGEHEDALRFARKARDLTPHLPFASRHRALSAELKIARHVHDATAITRTREELRAMTRDYPWHFYYAHPDLLHAEDQGSD